MVRRRNETCSLGKGPGRLVLPHLFGQGDGPRRGSLVRGGEETGEDIKIPQKGSDD